MPAPPPAGGAGSAPPSQVPLEVASWSPSYTVRGPAAEPLQKNWSPFGASAAD